MRRVKMRNPSMSRSGTWSMRGCLLSVVMNKVGVMAAQPPKRGRRVDIAHEALISGWPKLQEWLSERREAEQTRRRLEAKTEEWVRLGRGPGGLLDATELAEAERWLEAVDAS